MFGNRPHSTAKKVTRTALAALAAVSMALIAGCATGTDTGSGGDQKAVFWHYYAEGVPATKKYTADLTAIFNEQNPGYVLDPMFIPSDAIVQKLVAGAATGTGPDVFVQNGDSLPQLLAAGAVADFTEQFEAFPDKDLIPESAVTRIDGKVYGIKGFANGFGLWYNQDILDELGIAPPATLEELDAALATIAESSYIGIAIPAQRGEGTAFSLMTAFGWDYAKPDEKAAETGLAYVEKWRDAGSLPVEAANWTGDMAFQKFVEGQTAFAVGGNWQYGNAKAGAKFEYGLVPFPSGDKVANSYLLGDNVHMGAFTKDKDLAFRIIASVFLSADGELAALEAGSIPVRTDLADHEALKDPIYAQFLKSFENGVPYQIPGFGEELAQVKEPVNQAFSALVAGQISAKDAATQIVDGVQRVLDDKK